MTLKTLVTGVAAAAVVGAAAAGVTSIASGAPMAAAPAVQPVVFDIPLPLSPQDDLNNELTGVLYELANTSVPFGQKDNLVEGGVGIVEGRTADRLLQNGLAKGYFPLRFGVSNAVQTSDYTASANVTASGPSLAPVSQNVTFVGGPGNWKLSRGSATALLQSALA